MAMRGERAGRHGDSVTKAAQAGTPVPLADGPPFWRALGDLIRLVGRSNAPHLRLRLIAAITMTLAGKGLGVLGPLVLGAAVNHLAAGQGTAVAVGLGFAVFINLMPTPYQEPLDLLGTSLAKTAFPLLTSLASFGTVRSVGKAFLKSISFEKNSSV